jgi:membrane protease subunit HflC
VKIILAEACREAETLKGQGDGKAAAIYAKAYSSHGEFYKFIQSLEAIEKSGGVYQYLK